MSGGLDSNTKMKGISFPGKGELRIFPLCRTAPSIWTGILILQIPINTPRHPPQESIAYKRESGVLGIITSRAKSLGLIMLNLGYKCLGVIMPKQESCVLGFRVLFLNDIDFKLSTMARQ